MEASFCFQPEISLHSTNNKFSRPKVMGRNTAASAIDIFRTAIDRFRTRRIAAKSWLKFGNSVRPFSYFGLNFHSKAPRIDFSRVKELDDDIHNKNTMKQIEVVFIPGAALSHIVGAVETAKLLLERAERVSITVVIMKPFKDMKVDTYTEKISSSNPRLRIINLPTPDGPPTPSPTFVFDYMESRLPHVREIVSQLMEKSTSQLAGLVLDLFTTNFIDVAGEFGLPSYVFSTCGACYLGMSWNFISLINGHHLPELDSRSDDFELSVPYFSVPVPSKVLPGRNCEDHPTTKCILKCLMRLSEVKGIVVNTFYDLEPYAIDSLMSDVKAPKVYAVGPVLNSSSVDDDDDVKKWLDNQPEKSVIFLSFGTMGCLDEAQVREIALALEKCGYRFLWCLRNPGIPGVPPPPTTSQVLPEGFLERTKGIGKVIEWAPQKAVLAHPAVGGFVSHCGWNSTLESVWYGVPIAAFPLFAEQHLNAFQIVTELGMAEAITLDYQMDFTGEKPPQIAGWEEIAAAIRRLMAVDGGSGVRDKVKDMQKKARAAFQEGGSSYKALSVFIEDVIRNIS
ncbi:hypothetical protein C2S53_003724 [Perilla frutescens var. hirtella]|uniref:Glycosyltransferase n=1 Tax=Perilla frutescens var. hirtella TaxID=608512 RepID=A0AAD4J3C6_PERFH|nr:hypothetical protein C2S53_003724 [Perilla frutescens var. hirtella]